MMRKVMAGAVGTVLAMTMLAGTASAAGQKGPYGNRDTCIKVGKIYAEKYSVGPCQKLTGGWYFKYW